MWSKTNKKGYYTVKHIDVKPEKGESFGAACNRVSKKLGADFWENLPGSNETSFYKK